MISNDSKSKQAKPENNILLRKSLAWALSLALMTSCFANSRTYTDEANKKEGKKYDRNEE